MFSLDINTQTKSKKIIENPVNEIEMTVHEQCLVGKQIFSNNLITEKKNEDTSILREDEFNEYYYTCRSRQNTRSVLARLSLGPRRKMNK